MKIPEDPVFNVMFCDFMPVKEQMDIFTIMVEMDHFSLPGDLK